MRILYILVILFLRNCSTAPSPDLNFEIVVKPVIIMKTEESVIGLFNINTPEISPKDIDSSMSGEESNRVKRQAEEMTSAISDTTAMPTEAAPPAEEATISNVGPPEGEATPAVPPAESATTSAVPPTDNVAPATTTIPSTEGAPTSASPSPEVPVTAAAPSSDAVGTAEGVTEPAPASPPADPAQSPPENMEIPNKIVETATMIPAVTTIQKSAMDSPVVSQNADAIQKVVSQAPAIAPVVSQNADAVQKAASEAPAIAQNVETSGGFGFGMPDLSSLGSALGKLAESGQQIASDVKNAVTDMIGQLSNGISGLVG